MTFQSWMEEVDRAVSRIAGVSVHDLADWNFRDAFDAGEDPATVAEEVLIDNGWDAVLGDSSESPGRSPNRGAIRQVAPTD